MKTTLSAREKRRIQDRDELTHQLKQASKPKTKTPTTQELVDDTRFLLKNGFMGEKAKKILEESSKHDVDLAREKDDFEASENDRLGQIDLDSVQTMEDYVKILPQLRQMSMLAQREVQRIVQNKLSNVQSNNSETRRRNGDFDDRVVQLRKQLEAKVKKQLKLSHADVDRVVEEEVQRYLGTTKDKKEFCNKNGFYQRSDFKVDTTDNELEEIIKKSGLRNVKVVGTPAMRVKK